MPSKSKKKSRPTRSSSPSPSPSSRTPAAPSKPPSSGTDDEDAVNKRLLAAASEKFPHLISESAFCGRVSDIEPEINPNARLWMSRSAMESNDLQPHCLVTVSLSPGGKVLMNGCPLVSLAEECSRHFSIDLCDTDGTEAGSYFAMASVQPCQKTMKNGVRLSWALACTLGFPATGTGLFISPLRNRSTSNGLQRSSSYLHVQLNKCEDLYLSPLSSRTTEINKGFPVEISGKAFSIETENADASPKTPSYQPRLSTTASSPLTSKNVCNSLSAIRSFEAMDISAKKEVLSDKKLLPGIVSNWLHERHLFVGNFVAVPGISIFRVDGADNLTTTQCTSSLSESPSYDYKLKYFFVKHNKTKVHLQSFMGLTQETKTKVPPVGQRVGIIDIKVRDAPKLGGLSKEWSALKEIIEFSLMYTGSLPRYKGVLLHGPPGTGKTSLASFCAHHSGSSLFIINGPEIVSQYYGESEQALFQVFDAARQSAPAVVFIDELDAIAPTRKDGGEELSLRIVATLLKLMDEISETDRILIIAATNRPDSIDPALRRPGRLDREIEIGVPSPKQRFDILCNLLDGVHHSLSIDEILALAFATHGFVGADLAALCNEAAMTALRRYIRFQNHYKHSRECLLTNGFNTNLRSQSVLDDENGMPLHVDSLLSSLLELKLSPQSLCTSSSKDASGIVDTIGSFEEDGEKLLLQVTTEDFEKAKLKVRPSAMREVMLEFSKVSWNDVGGQDKVKGQLIEAVQWPQLCPDAFERLGIQPPRGLLMIGPPGCSKTLMARAVASEAKLNFLAVKGPELFSKWVGESEKAVRSLFAKARANAPAIIFFDEIDGLAITRGHDNDGTSVADRVLSQLLVEMDGLEHRSGVVVIAATNRPDKIDPALLRPGRFDRLLDVQPPDEFDREAIFRIHIRNMPCSSDVSPEQLAHLTEGYTGADIKLICREAAIAALEESLDISEVSMRHFTIGIGKVHPSNLQFYQELAAKFRRFVDSHQK